MTVRIKRAQRLLEIADRAVKSARASAAAAERCMVASRSEAHKRELAWEDAAQAFGSGVAFATDLTDQAARLRTLRVQADAAANELLVTIDNHRKALQAVVEASRKHRTLELWRDRLRDAEQDELRVLERRGSDELAARVVRAKT